MGQAVGNLYCGVNSTVIRLVMACTFITIMTGYNKQNSCRVLSSLLRCDINYTYCFLGGRDELCILWWQYMNPLCDASLQCHALVVLC